MESVKGSAKVDGGCRFTDTAFLVGDRDDLEHEKRRKERFLKKRKKGRKEKHPKDTKVVYLKILGNATAI